VGEGQTKRPTGRPTRGETRGRPLQTCHGVPRKSSSSCAPWASPTMTQGSCRNYSNYHTVRCARHTHAHTHTHTHTYTHTHTHTHTHTCGRTGCSLEAILSLFLSLPSCAAVAVRHPQCRYARAAARVHVALMMYATRRGVHVALMMYATRRGVHVALMMYATRRGVQDTSVTFLTRQSATQSTAREKVMT
jgi:hypothetical protein